MKPRREGARRIDLMRSVFMVFSVFVEVDLLLFVGSVASVTMIYYLRPLDGHLELRAHLL